MPIQFAGSCIYKHLSKRQDALSHKRVYARLPHQPQRKAASAVAEAALLKSFERG